MSPARSASASNSSGGKAALTGLLLVAVAIAMLLLVRARPGLDAFDPRSDAPDGTSAIVALLRKFGADVTISTHAPAARSGVRVLVLSDRLSDAQRDELDAFVAAGGVLIVADPFSELQPSSTEGAERVSDDLDPIFAEHQFDAVEESNVLRGTCTIGALADLRGMFIPDGYLFSTGDGASCFGDGAHAFVVARSRGDGVVVGLGDNVALTNQYIRHGDNAGLVTALAAPEGTGAVRIMLGSADAPTREDVGTGDDSLADLVRPGVWMGLTQLGLAFAVLCIARGVRPGRAVREPSATPIAGSELVVATGNLFQRARQTSRAAAIIRDEFRRDLCAALRAPASSTNAQLAANAAARTGVDAARIERALARDAATPLDLVRLRDEVAALRTDVITARNEPRDRSTVASHEEDLDR